MTKVNRTMKAQQSKLIYRLPLGLSLGLLLVALSGCYSSSTEQAPPPLSSSKPVAVDTTLDLATDNSGTVTVLTDDQANLSVQSVQSPTPNGGTATLNSDGTVTYTPPPGFEGTDSITFTIVDPATGLTSSGTINVTVGPQVVSNGKDYYTARCSVCHAAGTDDSHSAFNASDLAMKGSLIQADMSGYGGPYELMGAFFNVPKKTVDQLKAYVDSL